MFTLEITHKSKDVEVSYPMDGCSNILIQTKDIKKARMFKKRDHVRNLSGYMKAHDPSIESMKIVEIRRK